MRRPRELATGAGASERAAAAVAPVARAGQRAPSPADGCRGLGRPARNFPRRPPATRSQRGWRAPGRRGRHPRRRRRRRAPRGPTERGARGRGRAGTRYRAHRKNAIYPLSVLLGGWGMPRFPFTRGVINPNRGPGSVTRVITR